MDPRIKQYQELVQSMQRGEFSLPEAAFGDDDLGKLGDSLLRLSQSMDLKFRIQMKLLRFGAKLNEGVFVNDVLDNVFDTFRSVIPYNRIGFALLEKEASIIRSHWSRSDSDVIRLCKNFSQPMRNSSLKQILKTGQPRILNDLVAYLEENPDSASTRLVIEEGVQSSLTCPLLVMGKPMGFIFFSSFEKNTYADIHQSIFLRIASQLAAVLEKNKLYEELYKVNLELKKSRDDFKFQSQHDFLTDLWNRGASAALLDKEIARASRIGQGVGLLLADIDHFKQVNDQHGHQAGDLIIQEVAKRFKHASRTEDSVGRYGGEEFIVILSSIKQSEIEQVAERFRRIIGATPLKFSDIG